LSYHVASCVVKLKDEEKMKSRPVAIRWARLGPDDHSILSHTPRGGVCISAFVIARLHDSILLGRPRAHGAWPRRGGLRKSKAAELEAEGSWLLPATHLMMEESPDRAAKRIAHEWAGLKGTPRFIMVQSHVRPARLANSNLRGKHWDICFVYELNARGLPKPRPWWRELRFVSASEIRRTKLARGHRDILEDARLI
jgi:ADP-ribose pyrophosphatase YjhB (NUDIX family)